ncbi:MAG: glycosyltransferase family 9 protein, partial [Candidatus Binataceae bacterium]
MEFRKNRGLTARKVRRPWLTRACERLLLQMLPSAGDKVTRPLPAIPRRLLVVKVFGMGDGILVRSIVEYLRKHHPEMRIGVLVGPATREVMTLSATFRVHQYVPQTLSVCSALRTLMDIRNCHYDAILNCEQRSLAGSAFLAATGAAYRLGFLPLGDTPKSWFLTHTVRFRDDQSVWQSFIHLARLIECSLPEALLPTPFQWSAEVERWACNWWSEHIGAGRGPAIALHVGSQDREFSRWPVERFVELAERTRIGIRELPVILTGTLPEKELIRTFISRYSGHAIDASESGSLARTAALVKRCSLLVS